MKRADTSKVTEIHPDKEGPADEIALWHEAPEARIERIFTVIAHHEVVTRRDLATHALAGVLAGVGRANKFTHAQRHMGTLVVHQDLV